MITSSPVVRILLYLTLTVLVFLSSRFITDILLLSLVLVAAAAAGVPWKNIRRGVLPISIFVFFTFLSNVFFSHGRIVYEFWGIPVTEEGLRRGGHLGLHLLTLILGAKVLTAVTPVDDLVRGMVVLLGPVGRYRPVREFVETLSLTLCFLPIVYRESRVLYRETLKNSPEKGVTDRLRCAASLLVPAFERSLQKARDLAK